MPKRKSPGSTAVASPAKKRATVAKASAQKKSTSPKKATAKPVKKAMDLSSKAKNTNSKSAKTKPPAKSVKAVKSSTLPTKGANISVTGSNFTNSLKDSHWKSLLQSEFDKDFFKEIEAKLAAEYNAKKQIFPPKDLIFNAFNLTPLKQVKVVILGQDPYHDDDQAMGLSFSVPRDIAIPGSLRNIYNELERDPKIPGFTRPDHGCLEKWAKEGILLLNATLTVEAHKPNSHAKFGWQKFTDTVIRLLSEHCCGLVFILWGGFAHKKAGLIDTTKHEVIKTAHPSPLSVKHFKECDCFSDCNDALKRFGKQPMSWLL